MFSVWSLSPQSPVCISVSPIRPACPDHLIPLHWMSLLIFGEQLTHLSLDCTVTNVWTDELSTEIQCCGL